jgi:hypothetical protein
MIRRQARTAWGIQGGRRRPQAAPQTGHKAVWGVARPQVVEGSGMAGRGETLGSPWIPLPVRACQADNVKKQYYLLTSTENT